MIVNDFNVAWTVGAFRPTKAYAPLLIDADAELVSAIAPQVFQMIARKAAQIGEACRCFQNFEPFSPLALKALKRTDELTVRELLRPSVLETQDHRCPVKQV